MLDRSILTRRIHSLKDQQQAPPILRIELVLKFLDMRHALFQQSLGLLLGLQFPRVLRVEVFQAKLNPVTYAVRFRQFACPVHQFSTYGLGR